MREIVARRCLERHSNNLKNLEDSERTLYCSFEMRKEVIKEVKATWFRAHGASATVIVPWTSDSTQARKLRKVIETSKGPRGTNVKDVEKPGQTIMS